MLTRTTVTRFVVAGTVCLAAINAVDRSVTAEAAGPKVQIVVGAKASALEKRGADEVAATLRRLYDAEVQVTSEPGDAANQIAIGNPSTNELTRRLAEKWPKLSPQGHCIRTISHSGRSVLAIGGGSAAATYWAASEFCHQLGVRSLLYGDLDPVSPPSFHLDGFDLVIEPKLVERAWRTVNDFPIGPESWGVEEQRQIIRQLAKQKYNHLVISVYPWQPFVHFEFGGVKKETGVLWYGWTYPVSGDSAGRGAFGGAKVFENPDFKAAKTYEARVAAGTKLIQEIIDVAHDYGMTVGMLTSPLEFPKEFARALPDAKPVRGLADLTVGPGRTQKLDDDTLLQLTNAQLKAYINTYPKLDAFYLSLPEFPEWDEHAEGAWQRLSAHVGGSGLPSLAELTERARNRPLISSKERGERALRGNLVALDFFLKLRANPQLFRSPGGRELDVRIVDIDPALFAYVDKVVPPGTGALHFVDYTARRVSQNKSLLEAVPAKKMHSSLILTLADDNVGVLPQSSPTALSELLAELRKNQWSGFMTRYWCVGDLDLSSYLISRGSFDEKLTVESACIDLVTSACGEGVSDRVLKAMNSIEQATTMIDENDIGFSFPVPNVVMKHYTATDVPEWWGKVRDHYLNAMNEMYRTNTRAREGGRSYSLYWARRSEFGFEYMNCIEAVRKAGIAKSKGDGAEQKRQLEAAVESMNGALNAMAAVARSNSDRGIIAVLNEYGYRPLTRELEAVEDAAGKE